MCIIIIIRMLMRDEEGKEERSKQGHTNNKATCMYVCVRPALLTYSTNECLLASIIIFVAYPCSYVLTHIQHVFRLNDRGSQDV